MKNWRRMLYLKIAKMSRGSNTPVPSIISIGTKIKGNILGGDIIHIDGKLEGNVCCNELIIGVKGQVIGQVKAQTLNLYGSLHGTAEVENLFVAVFNLRQNIVYLSLLVVFSMGNQTNDTTYKKNHFIVSECSSYVFVKIWLPSFFVSSV